MKNDPLVLTGVKLVSLIHTNALFKGKGETKET